MAQTFNYSFTDGLQSDILTVTASQAVTNTNGLGVGYLVTSVSGSIGGTPITGLVAGSQSIIYANNSAGFGGSVNGIDGDGIQFLTATATYELYESSGQFTLYNVTTNTKSTLVSTFSSAPCFCAGTAILTATGERPVEALSVGDVVVTASGGHRPIRWIGRRAYARRFLAGNPAVHPVRIRAGALGGGLPHRDLLVSPDHAMFLQGVLVPAGQLVNGSTIVRERGLDGVEYFHVELDSHDVIVAEGAATESFVDDDSRGLFHNAADWDRQFPGRVPVPAVFCHPRVESGPALDAIRRGLDALAEPVARAA